jgi:hypothetical protein
MRSRYDRLPLLWMVILPVFRVGARPHPALRVPLPLLDELPVPPLDPLLEELLVDPPPLLLDPLPEELPDGPPLLLDPLLDELLVDPPPLDPLPEEPLLAPGTGPGGIKAPGSHALVRRQAPIARAHVAPFEQRLIIVRPPPCAARDRSSGCVGIESDRGGPGQPGWMDCPSSGPDAGSVKKGPGRSRASPPGVPDRARAGVRRAGPRCAAPNPVAP